jgi:hypothetical protein
MPPGRVRSLETDRLSGFTNSYRNIFDVLKMCPKVSILTCRTANEFDHGFHMAQVGYDLEPKGSR